MALTDRFDLVIFDWAGTTVDFGCCAPVAALRELFARRGIDISDAQARRDMGRAKAEHLRALLDEPAIAQAWVARHGALATGADFAALMAELAPLMRDHAGRAARLIHGVRSSIEALRALGVKIGSSTGYTREMMQPVLSAAAAQGYSPDHVVCSGETPLGRPTPLMIYRACADLGVWPLSRAVKVDDTQEGVREGRAAGCFTVGVSASGNGVGLGENEFLALEPRERCARVAASACALSDAGADVVIETVAELLPVLTAHGDIPLREHGNKV